VQSLNAHLGDGSRPTLFQLRVTERDIRLRLHDLDSRVQDALDSDEGLGTSFSVAVVDVLCASIMELRELLDETRAEISRAVAVRDARRREPRRWN
jgi:hypothetical protein